MNLPGPRALPALRSLRDALLAFVYPEVCQLCRDRHATPDAGYVCDACRTKIQLITPPYCGRCGVPYEGQAGVPFECDNCAALELHFRAARSVIEANATGLDLIHRYKYRRALWFDPLFARLLRDHAAPEVSARDWDALVPVPLHPAKEREREYNQAARLAGHLSRCTGVPVLDRCLRRRTATGTQTALSRTQRAANMRGAFALAAPLPRGCRRIIVVDDVLTTGSTLSECARALRAGGAEDVMAWTLARGLPSGRHGEGIAPAGDH